MDDATLTAFLDRVYDFSCDQPVASFVDREHLLAALDDAAQPDRVARAVERLRPVRERLFERAKKSELKLGVWLPEPLKDAVAAFLGQPVKIPRKLIDEAVTSERMRENLRAMMQESISSVLTKATTASPGGRGLRGMIGLAGAAGRGLLGGLGEEIQRQLEERVRDFVDGGVSMVQQRIAQKLASEETANELGHRRKKAFLHLMETSEADAARTVERAPWPLLDGLWPVALKHNLQRAEVRAAILAEVDAALADVGAQKLGALLDEAGLREHLRGWLHRKGLPLAKSFLTWQPPK